MNVDVEWIAADELPRLTLPEEISDARPFFESLISDSRKVTEPLVDNVVTDGRLIRVGTHFLPVTVNDNELDNSWVCSPYNAAVTYPLEELRHIHSAVGRGALSGMIRSLGPLMRAGSLNKSVCVNNWMLSTNLYPDLADDALQQLTTAIRERFPKHAILFRSLNAVTNGPTMTCLRNGGYLLAPSRQVYLFDGQRPTFLKRSNSQRDLKLLSHKNPFREVRHDEVRFSSLARIRELYDLLYLHKYSFHNPQFTERLIRTWHESGMMTFFGLANDTGQLNAIVGTFAMNGVVTAPLVGYDTSLPQKLGLYRMLMAHVLQKAAADLLLLNLSAGAASFKRLRGGQAELEYSAVYCQHLPRRQRLAWTALVTLLNQVGGRVLQRYRL
ncbi:MAG: GNAT family N-acetyltransferase [Planctomycetales bacterium]